VTEDAAGHLNLNHTVASVREAHPETRRAASRIHLWRRTAFSGIVLLCVSFFLPQVRGCGVAVVPARETLATRGAFLFGLGLPFLMGFVALLIAVLWHIAGSRRARGHLAAVACAVTALMLGLGVGMLVVEFASSIMLLILDAGVSPLVAFQSFVRGGLSGEVMMPCTLLGACALLVECAVVLYVWVGSRPAFRMPVCLLCVSLSSLVYFLFVGRFVCPAAYGLWLSVLACVLMAVGALGEILVALPACRWPSSQRGG